MKHNVYSFMMNYYSFYVLNKVCVCVCMVVLVPLVRVRANSFKPAGLVPLVRVNSELGVIMVIAVSCVKLLSAHNSTQHTSRKHKV